MTVTQAPVSRLFPGGLDALKDRQLVFRLVQQIARAQFVMADREMTRRLWQEVADLGMDPERIIGLLYGTADLSDIDEMESIDQAYRNRLGRHPQPARGMGGWFGLRPRALSGLPRSARPSGVPGHRAAR